MFFKFQVNQYMNRAEELKQCFKIKSQSNPDELLAHYSREHSELKEALKLANIAEIRASLKKSKKAQWLTIYSLISC